MARFLIRLRGALSTGILWAIGWGVAFLGLGLLLGPAQTSLLVLFKIGMFFGFVGGVSFALIMSFAERKRTLDQLSLWRVALWGFFGATALLLSFTLLPLGPEFSFGSLIAVVVGGLLGAGFAAGSVAIARQGDIKLIESEEDAVLSL
jgi:hypothetical protein